MNVPFARPVHAAAVLCPGPSLYELDGTGNPDAVIAVNRAATVFGADFWVTLDAYTADWDEVVGTPALVCTHVVRNKIIEGHPALAAGGHVEVDRLTLPGGGLAQPFVRWGWGAAVLTAAAVGAVRIDCYGMDWEGEGDFDGFCSSHQNRTPARWGREKKLFGRLRGKLAADGISLQRHVPAGRATA